MMSFTNTNEPSGNKKTVRFNLNGLDQVLPAASKRAQTEFHRVSSEPARIIPSIEQIASSHTASVADGDNDGNENEEEEGDNANDTEDATTYIPSFEDYNKEVAPNLTRYRVKKTEIDEELLIQLEKLEEEFDGVMPCVPQTEKGRSVWKLGTRISYEQFKQLAVADQRLLFDELRLAMLMNLSSRIVINDIHNIAKKTNRSLSELELWAEHMGQEMIDNFNAYTDIKTQLSDGLREWSDCIHGLNVRIGELQIAADDATTEAKDHAEAMVALNIQRMKDRAKIIDLKKQLAEAQAASGNNSRATPTIQRPAGVSPVDTPGTAPGPVGTGDDPNNPDDSSSDDDALPIGGPPRSDRQGTPGTTYTEYSEGGTRRQVKRSAKVPDPPAWHNDPTVDRQTYRVWRRKLTNKLTNNADHYGTDAARQGAIEGFLDGPAANALAPYLDEDHPDRIATSDGLLTWLDNEFFNPHEKADAKVEWRTGMMMKTSDAFNTYRNKFVATAGTIHLPKGEWKEEMHDRLSEVPRLRNQLTTTYLDPNKTFEDYCLLAQQLDADQRRQQLLRKKDDKPKDTPAGGSRNTRNDNKPATTPTTGNANRSGGGSRPTTRLSSSAGNAMTANAMEIAASNGVSQKDLASRVENNLCYHCGGDGHISKYCPQRAAQREEHRRAQVAAVEAAYTAKVNSNTSKLDMGVNGGTTQGKN